MEQKENMRLAPTSTESAISDPEVKIVNAARYPLESSYNESRV